MHATNELSCFRYAAVIHVKAQNTPQPLQDRGISQDAWIDFMKQQLDNQSLLGLLQSRRTLNTLVAVANIPCRKTSFERHVIDLLDSRGKFQGASNWLSSARQTSLQCPSLSAVDLVAMAQETGYRVEISWARQHSQRGGLDAIFHHHEAGDHQGRMLFQFPVDHDGRPYDSLSSRPLQQRWRQKIQIELLEMLQSRLPSYMLLQAVTILDKFPLSPNGKIDRRALPNRSQSQATTRGPIRPPVMDEERQVQNIWGQVLNIEIASIGLDDNIFHLGGNSITAMMVATEARNAGIECIVANISLHPKLQDVARQAAGESVSANLVEGKDGKGQNGIPR